MAKHKPAAVGADEPSCSKTDNANEPVQDPSSPLSTLSKSPSPPSTVQSPLKRSRDADVSSPSSTPTKPAVKRGKLSPPAVFSDGHSKPLENGLAKVRLIPSRLTHDVSADDMALEQAIQPLAQSKSPATPARKPAKAHPAQVASQKRKAAKPSAKTQTAAMYVQSYDNDDDEDELAIETSPKLKDTNSRPSKSLPSSSEATEASSGKGPARSGGRKRNAPSKLTDDTEPKPAKSVGKGSRKKQPPRDNFSPSHLMQDPKSKFTQVDLLKLLNHERAWMALTHDERRHLASLLPKNRTSELPKSPTSDDGSDSSDSSDVSDYFDSFATLQALANHRKTHTFKTDLADFQKHLEAGFYQPTWLDDAANAMERRANGDFDDWKERERETTWNVSENGDAVK